MNINWKSKIILFLLMFSLIFNFIFAGIIFEIKSEIYRWGSIAIVIIGVPYLFKFLIKE
jgi:hypothetical protein